MTEQIHPDPWRTRADYNEDRNRMKLAVYASFIASIGAVISSISALIAVLYAICK